MACSSRAYNCAAAWRRSASGKTWGVAWVADNTCGAPAGPRASTTACPAARGQLRSRGAAGKAAIRAWGEASGAPDAAPA
ncbi:hypothetical protein G6F60_015115 [Rhizopus arrhizus]|nr:hypothetical protein G6F60_015115 [Rhizopus arrhizus]